MSTLCKNLDLSITWKGSLAVPTAVKQVFLSRLRILHLRQPKTVQVGPFEQKKKKKKKVLKLYSWLLSCGFCILNASSMLEWVTLSLPIIFVRLFACLVQFLFLFLLGIKPNPKPNPKLRLKFCLELRTCFAPSVSLCHTLKRKLFHAQGKRVTDELCHSKLGMKLRKENRDTMLFKGPWSRIHVAIPYQTVDISFLSITRSYFVVFVCSVTLCFFHIPAIHLVQIRQPKISFEHSQSHVYITETSCYCNKN